MRAIRREAQSVFAAIKVLVTREVVGGFFFCRKSVSGLVLYYKVVTRRSADLLMSITNVVKLGSRGHILKTKNIYIY